MSFLEVSGERSDGSRYIQNGYIYVKDTRKNGNQYVKCSVMTCRGTGVVRHNSDSIKINKPHNHEPCKKDEERTLFRHSLREKSMATDCPSFRNVFDAESFRLVPRCLQLYFKVTIRVFSTRVYILSRYPVGSLLQGFPQAEQLMRRSRNTSVPPRPKNLDDLHDILNLQPRWRDHALALNSHKEFFVETRHVENVTSSRVSVMVSPYFSDLLTQDGIDLAMDATFDTRWVML